MGAGGLGPWPDAVPNVVRQIAPTDNSANRYLHKRVMVCRPQAEDRMDYNHNFASVLYNPIRRHIVRQNLFKKEIITASTFI